MCVEREAEARSKNSMAAAVDAILTLTVTHEAVLYEPCSHCTVNSSLVHPVSKKESAWMYFTI